MAIHTFPSPELEECGPIFQVVLRPGQLMVSAVPDAPHTFVETVCLVDTGAQNSVITPDVAKRLNLNPVGVISLRTATDVKEVNQYNIDFVLPDGIVIRNILAMEAPLLGQKIECILGRDVLANGILLYVGPVKQFTLSF